MNNRRSTQFYFLSLAALIVLSAYPLFHGARTLFFHFANGAVEPEQYAKYVVPYTAMCVSVILFAAFAPWIAKIRRFAFPAGLAGAFAAFFGLEQLIERIQIRTTGMSLLDTATLAAAPTLGSATVDVWQASLCAVSPLPKGQTVAYASADRVLYVMSSDAYKVHYYLIMFILIAMICGLVYGIGQMLRGGDASKRMPLLLQGISTASLLALCVFANTTAFFRQGAAIQTPLASVLTCLFFTVLGVSTGVYIGSLSLKKGALLRVWLPVLCSVLAVILMYVGEAVMMNGGLYRFGTGWFFAGLPAIALAPVDIAVILLSGALVWGIMNAVGAKRQGARNEPLSP